MSIDLSISGSRVDPVCARVTELLRASGVVVGARVTPNVSLVDGRVENGCAIRLPRTTNVAKVWGALRGPLALDCAHIAVAGTFDGCLAHYLTDRPCLRRVPVRDHESTHR